MWKSQKQSSAHAVKNQEEFEEFIEEEEEEELTSAP
jgi:predicted house-cleaning noncanonical NTP pyrophosphatase (MazG superfamily)